MCNDLTIFFLLLCFVTVCTVGGMFGDFQWGFSARSPRSNTGDTFQWQVMDSFVYTFLLLFTQVVTLYNPVPKSLVQSLEYKWKKTAICKSLSIFNPVWSLKTVVSVLCVETMEIYLRVYQASKVILYVVVMCYSIKSFETSAHWKNKAVLHIKQFWNTIYSALFVYTQLKSIQSR